MCTNEVLVNSIAECVRVCVQFQRLAVQTVCCGWNPWALSELHTSEVDSTMASLNKGQRSSPKGSL